MVTTRFLSALSTLYPKSNIHMCFSQMYEFFTNLLTNFHLGIIIKTVNEVYKKHLFNLKP